MIICDNCGIHADSDYGDCVFDDVHSFCSEECNEKFNNNKGAERDFFDDEGIYTVKRIELIDNLKGSNSTHLKKENK
jgi:hypothetical protein